ncbi:MAG: ScpA family protein [Pseudomonadota bacterium]|nr:ScpA family protein [Pseudomonadota bacterium]
MSEDNTSAVIAANENEPFEDERPPYKEGRDELVLDIGGYEGPIDVLLTLARDQKVDLTKISILELAEQYLSFIAEARRLRIELAADYLVMAAWLAYLKSRLLLPPTNEEDEPSAAEMAARLAFQLQRLEAMRNAAEKLFERNQMDKEFYRRGDPERMPVIRTSVFELSLYELLSVYGAHHQRQAASTLQFADMEEVFSIEDALNRLRELVGEVPDWTVLTEFLPQGLRSALTYKSAVATTFVATLELARTRRISIRQSGTFEPIYIKTLETNG